MQVVGATESTRQQRRAAGGLHAAGLRAGDRVAVLASPSPGLLALVLGALRTGIVPVLLDPAAPPAERAELLADARPALTVPDDAPLTAADDASLTVAGHATLTRLLDAAPVDLAAVPLARPMHYTSGTTGRRKGVWSGVLAEDAAKALLAEETELWGFHAGDRHLVVSPLHHSAPLRFAAGTLMAGGTVALGGPFNAARTLDLLATFRPTTLFCVPTQLRRLMAAAGAGAGLPPLGQLRLLAHAAEACPPGLKRRLIDELPPGSVYEFYGSTEAQFTVCTSQEWLDRPGTVGRARPGRRLQVDDDRLVWCRLPPYARFSYWDDPAKTAAAWRGDELTVGDLGRLDADGYLYLDGRREDLVISGGVNVYPGEVERVLATCEGVEQVAAFGVADEQWGQRLCAAVVGEATEQALSDFARRHLSAAKRPKAYYKVSRLPTTATGKVRRLDLPGLLGLE
ncbi:MAG TPA: AMP-binding protein [Micromonosporaceae bacterium]|nr:AMP-binding protein [Micromonosporaceae bacterium]